MPGQTLGSAYVQIVPSAQGIQGSIQRALGGEAESAGSSLGSSIASFAKKAIAAAGIGTAIVAGIKASVGEGAKLQQSYIGGLETLYGDAAGEARKYAREASAAGISMNDYSEQAVSFGAALKKAYGGDVRKSAQAANTAIMDMADNSAKMGTDIGSVQMAYQGFAKQNYTMLDNLKLGYGGTKTEMERLLADAEKLSGQTYSIDNLGDVYDAIHVIQQDMGLTGVAAQEASQTFSGSFGAMKAAAQNFAGSLALGQGVQPAFTQLISSIKTFVSGNLIPMLKTIVTGLIPVIVSAIKVGVPALVSNIVTFLTTSAATLKEKANSITAGKVKEWAVATIPKLLTSAGQLMKKLATGFITNLPVIVSSIGKIGLSIVKGLGSALWPKIKEAASGIVGKFTSGLDNLKSKVSTIFENVKKAILSPIEKAREKISDAISAIKGIFSGLKLSLPHFKLPHFKISAGKAPWGIGGKGTPPSFDVDWFAKGGIFDSPSLIGIGEAGPEAVVPLNKLWDKLDRIADASGSGNVTVNVYGAPGMSVSELAAAVEERIVRQTKQRRAAWSTI